ncbi:hypothetical protein F2Q68_00007709 [Brassica cretica]|uniref:RNase H type-1 domain-containing protein n=1 Tax=Brassica cretica TaxID=69181 RepID=A0A8S9KVT8_BRACR|nr:hypothetical protein F2Q68_00007709 [Brassica cretica]
MRLARHKIRRLHSQAKNRFVFEGFYATPEDTLSSAIILAREWSNNCKPEPAVNKRSSRQIPEARSETMIVRSDAAWSSTSRKQDSALLIKCINLDSVFIELHSIVSDVLAFASEFQSVSFVWIPREKNMVADSLAKLVLNFVDDVVVADALNAPN